LIIIVLSGACTLGHLISSFIAMDACMGRDLNEGDGLAVFCPVKQQVDNGDQLIVVLAEAHCCGHVYKAKDLLHAAQAVSTNMDNGHPAEVLPVFTHV
jgi:hypothetical protein